MTVDRTVKPFTLYQRKGLCRQDGFGHRCTNNWHSGDLPAPWAEGDLIFIPEDKTNDRMDDLGWGYFVVSAGFSIDDGDAWYFRVTNTKDDGSDRLHVAHAERSTWNEDADWMAGWELIETSDPEGLATRKRLLAKGWKFQGPEVCPTCGQRVYK